MSMHNEFASRVACPHCGDDVEILFQADIGALELRVFAQGEQVIDIPTESDPPVYSPGPSDRTADFWAYGIGMCPDCHNFVWSKVIIRSKNFEAVELIQYEPDDMYRWGIFPSQSADS